MAVIQIYPRVFIDEKIFNEEYAYRYGSKKDVLVEFNYVNEKNDKYTPKKFTYSKAITLAEERKNDGRYKNYRYEIYAIDK